VIVSLSFLGCSIVHLFERRARSLGAICNRCLRTEDSGGYGASCSCGGVMEPRHHWRQVLDANAGEEVPDELSPEISAAQARINRVVALRTTFFRGVAIVTILILVGLVLTK